MGNYASLKNPKSIAIGVFALLFLGYLLGIRFDNVYVDKLIGLLLLGFPAYAFALVLEREFKKASIKIILAIFFGLLALGSLPFMFFSAFDVYFISQYGGMDPAFEKVRTLDLNSSKVVVYRTNGGATTDFGVTVRVEKTMLPGVYIKRDLFSIYHTDDVKLSAASSSGSIMIDSIEFTNPQYRQEYLSNSPSVVEGQTITIN